MKRKKKHLITCSLQFIFFSISALLLSQLSSCAAGKTVSSESPVSPSPSTEEKTQSAEEAPQNAIENSEITENDEGDESPEALTYSISNHEPKVFGEAWTRKITLHGNEVDHWNIEKQCHSEDSAWFSVGVSNKFGEIIDHSINKKCRYRVDDFFVSDWNEAYDDLILDNLTLQKNTTLSATRILLPHGKAIAMRNFNLVLKGRNIYINGPIFAYYSTYRSHLKHSGLFSIFSYELLLNAPITLDGASGANGAHARHRHGREKNIVGLNGANAGSGGNAGRLHLNYKELTKTASFQFSALGGKKGIGGNPGLGGVKSNAQGFIHPTKVQLMPSGRKGKDGFDGKNGNILYFPRI